MKILTSPADIDRIDDEFQAAIGMSLAELAAEYGMTREELVRAAWDAARYLPDEVMEILEGRTAAATIH
jgi:hypothetical protein